MSSSRGRRGLVPRVCTILFLALLASIPSPVEAQRGIGGGSSVGGISIDPSGLLMNATTEQVAMLKRSSRSRRWRRFLAT